MPSSHPHRHGGAQAPATGTCNRGFVSCDPERQREDATDEATSAKAQPAGGFRFDVRRLPGAVRAPATQAAPQPAARDEARQGRRGARRKR